MRSRLIVLWILLALLPLRGWAYSGMQVEMAAGELAMATPSGETGEAAAAHHAAPPCHQESASTDASADAESTVSGHAACLLCDLCHSVALFNAAPPVGAVPVEVARVHCVTGTDTGRSLVGGLDRPPRISIA